MDASVEPRCAIPWARLVLAIALLALGATKLLPQESPHASHHGSPAHSRAIPAFLPVAAMALELGIGALLLTRWWRPAATGALLLSSGLSGGFAALLLAGVPARACGCFGPAAVGAFGHGFVLAGLSVASLAAVVWAASRGAAWEARVRGERPQG